MVRFTFGISCSPFLATQVLRQLAADYADKFPNASQAILKSFYVDNFLSGADSVEEAVELRKSLNALLDKGRMTLSRTLFLITCWRRSRLHNSLRHHLNVIRRSGFIGIHP